MHYFSLFVSHFIFTFLLCQCLRSQFSLSDFAAIPVPTNSSQTGSPQGRWDWANWVKSTFRAVPKTGCFPGNMENLVHLMTYSMHRFPDCSISPGSGRELAGNNNSSSCRKHPSASSPARVEAHCYAPHSIWGGHRPLQWLVSYRRTMQKPFYL